MTLTAVTFDLDAIRENPTFEVKSVDGLHLVTPIHTKWSWTVDERPLRSVIVDDVGRVVSSGMPKFGNYGEPSFEDHRTIIDQEIADPNTVVRFMHKYDGSLIIRSVINGDVIFRTRGTIDGGEHGAFARKLAERHYPDLLNPDVFPGHSLHFELVSPHDDHHVIIRYETPDLVFLGGIRHDDLAIVSFDDATAIAEHHALRMVDAVPVSGTVSDVRRQVAEDSETEGVVVCSEDGQTMVKMKSSTYLAAHRLKFRMTDKGLLIGCYRNNVRSIDDYRTLVQSIAGDWELLTFTERLVERYIECFHHARRTVDSLMEQVPQVLADLDHDRKAFAVEFAGSLPKFERAVAFAIANGNRDRQKLFVDALGLRVKEKTGNVLRFDNLPFSDPFAKVAVAASDATKRSWWTDNDES